MFNRIGYWLRETVASLRRNLTLTMAAVLTAAVSLALLGVALLAREGVGNQLVQWKGGVQFIVFMKAEATDDQIQTVRTALAESPQVDDAKTVYLDKPAAFQEFQRIFKDQKTIAESLTDAANAPRNSLTTASVIDRDATNGRQGIRGP